MAFPAIQPTNSVQAQTLLFNAASAAGITNPAGGLTPVDMTAAVVANLCTDLPANANIPATAVIGTAGGQLAQFGAAAGAAQSVVERAKSITAIADNTFTDVFTVTVPNAQHQAFLRVTFSGALGAGGAVGAGEASGVITYDFAITRTAGVATVVGAATATGSATAAVAGAATITITGQASSVTGGNSATQTFTVQVKIVKGSGSSANHTCLALARLMNVAASGVTIA